MRRNARIWHRCRSRLLRQRHAERRHCIPAMPSHSQNGPRLVCCNRATGFAAGSTTNPAPFWTPVAPRF